MLRADLNVPFVPGTTTISDDSRIQATRELSGISVSRSLARRSAQSRWASKNAAEVSPSRRMMEMSRRIVLANTPHTRASAAVN